MGQAASDGSRVRKAFLGTLAAVAMLATVLLLVVAPALDADAAASARESAAAAVAERARALAKWGIVEEARRGG